MPFRSLHLFALQYNLLSAQFHAELPDHRQLQEAFRQIPGDAAFPHLHKMNSCRYEELFCLPLTPPPSPCLLNCLINFCMLSIYLRIGDSQATSWSYYLPFGDFS